MNNSGGKGYSGLCVTNSLQQMQKLLGLPHLTRAQGVDEQNTAQPLRENKYMLKYHTCFYETLNENQSLRPTGKNKVEFINC